MQGVFGGGPTAGRAIGQVLFEPLEPRLLLSADPLLAYMANERADLLLRIDDSGATPAVELLDLSAASSAVIAREILDDPSRFEIRITGSSLDDSLTIDASVFEHPSLVVAFDGGDGRDTLAGPDSGAVWSVTGPGTGTLGDANFTGVESFIAGAGEDTLIGPDANTTWTVSGDGSGDVAGIAFSGFENLVGAPDNEDTFVVGADGALSGVIDGGEGGFDSMVFEDGVFSTVE
jgi:hypothetical protein